MSDTLNSRNDSLPDAGQSLELLVDFQEEFKLRIDGLGAMRQSLTELMLMETTVGRIARAMQPLAELGNLRRLADSDLREAARVVLEKRNARIGLNTDSVATPAETPAIDAELADPLSHEPVPFPVTDEAELDIEELIEIN